MQKVVTKLQERLPASVRQLLTGRGLKARSTRAGAWLAGASAFDQGFRFVKNMILTRVLLPEAFGLMALVLSVNAFFESFTDLGIDSAIVQNPRSEEHGYLNAAWWISVGRAVASYAVVFVSTHWVAEFYRQPRLASLMRIAFLAIILRGAVSPRMYVSHKKMDFKRLTGIYQGAGVCGTLTTIVLSLLMRNVWALVIGSAIEAAYRLILSFILCPFKPRLDWDKGSAREIYRYSRGMVGIPVLTFIFMRADIFVLGRLRPTAELGVYSMATQLGQIGFMFFGPLISQIANPAFAEIQRDNLRLRTILLKITELIGLLIFPAIMFVSLYGRELLRYVYGPIYSAAAVPFAVLFAVSLTRVLMVPVNAILFMIGKPEVNRLYLALRTGLMVLLIYPGVRLFGSTGAALVGLIAMTSVFVLQMFPLRHLIGLNLLMFYRSLARPFPFSLIVTIVWLISFRALRMGAVIHLATGCIATLLACVMFFLWPTIFNRANSLIKKSAAAV